MVRRRWCTSSRVVRRSSPCTPQRASADPRSGSTCRVGRRSDPSDPAEADRCSAAAPAQTGSYTTSCCDRCPRRRPPTPSPPTMQDRNRSTTDQAVPARENDDSSSRRKNSGSWRTATGCRVEWNQWSFAAAQSVVIKNDISFTTAMSVETCVWNDLKCIKYLFLYIFIKQKIRTREYFIVYAYKRPWGMFFLFCNRLQVNCNSCTQLAML